MMMMKVAVNVDMDDDENLWICVQGRVDNNKDDDDDDDDLRESLKQDQNLVGIVVNDIM